MPDGASAFGHVSNSPRKCAPLLTSEVASRLFHVMWTDGIWGGLLDMGCMSLYWILRGLTMWGVYLWPYARQCGLHLGWDPSLLPPYVAYLVRRGPLDRIDGLPTVPTWKHRVRPYYIEGVRIDVGGLRIPYRTSGGAVCDIVCTVPSAVFGCRLNSLLFSCFPFSCPC